MANGILSAAKPAAPQNTPQYLLPEADRRAIQAQAGPTAAQRTEALRVAFVAACGCAFGQNFHSQNHE
jgi:hypothetical protein